MAYNRLTVAALVSVLLARPLNPSLDRQFSPLDKTGHFVQTDSRDAMASHILVACPSDHPGDYTATIKEEETLAATLEHGGPAAKWSELACQRARLLAMGAMARSGPLMPVGVSWAEAAVNSAVQALTLDPAGAQAATVLAIIGPQVVPRVLPAALEPNGTILGSQNPIKLGILVYRAAKLGVAEPMVLRGCTSLMLDAGDPGTAHDCSRMALAAGFDSTWHLIRLSWLATLRGDLASAAQLYRLGIAAARDPVSRAEAGGTLEPRVCRDHQCSGYGILENEMTPAERTRWLAMPDSALWPLVEQRLAELAPGDTTRAWRTGTGTLAAGRAMIQGAIDESPLIRHLVMYFRASISYAGGTFRVCQNGILDCALVLKPQAPPGIALFAGMMHLWDPATSKRIDLAPYALLATDLATTDSGGKQFADFRLDLRRWSTLRASDHDTTITIHMPLSPGEAKHFGFAGYVVVPAMPDVDGWSLMAVQPGLRHGGVYQESKPPLDDGPLAISDLVLGAESQGLTWRAGGEPVPLSPDGSIEHNEIIRLYYQVMSNKGRGLVRTRLAFYADGTDPRTAKPTLQLAFPEAVVEKGLNEIRRDVNASRLAPGGYTMIVEVTDASDSVTTRRSTVMFVH